MEKEKLKTKETFSNFLGGAGISRKKIEEAISKNQNNPGESVPTPSIDEIVEVLKSLDPIYKSLDMDKERVEGIYSLGCSSYDAGKYEDAINYYRLCYILDGSEEKYLFSLGLALEMDGQFFEAITAYTVWNSLVNKNSPLGDFRMGVCYLELDEKDTAKNLFSSVIEFSNGKEDFKSVEERAILYLEGLK